MGSREGRRWLVDGMNVIGTRPDGWWRDRDEAVRRLAGRLRKLAAAGEPATLVLDGAPLPDLPEGSADGVEVLYARRPGADAADDRIVELVREDPGAWRVVTSDRTLRERVAELGAAAEGASAFLERLDRVEEVDRGAAARRDDPADPRPAQEAAGGRSDATDPRTERAAAAAPTRPRVLHLQPADVDAVISVLCEAFRDYPVLRYVLGPEGPEHLESLVRMFAMARVLRGEPMLGVPGEHHLIGAALVSFPDGPPSPPEFTRLREAVWRKVGDAARARYEAFSRATAAFDPGVPHVHLNMVGVRASHRGRGLARLLIDEVQRISRERPGSGGVTLTTEDPANVRLYQHLGFEVIGHGRFAPGLESWGMFRPD